MHIFNLRSSRISKFGFKKFYKLANNSFKAKNYPLTADNCRLSVNIALSENNLKQAAKAYELWIKSLFEENNYAEVKKVCCMARSKFGNNLDFLYYEFKAAISIKDFNIAVRLGKEFIDVCKSMKGKPSGMFSSAYNKLDEVSIQLKEIEDTQSKNITEKNRSK